MWELLPGATYFMESVLPRSSWAPERVAWQAAGMHGVSSIGQMGAVSINQLGRPLTQESIFVELCNMLSNCAAWKISSVFCALYKILGLLWTTEIQPLTEEFEETTNKQKNQKTKKGNRIRTVGGFEWEDSGALSGDSGKGSSQGGVGGWLWLWS